MKADNLSEHLSPFQGCLEKHNFINMLFWGKKVTVSLKRKLQVFLTLACSANELTFPFN